MSGGGVLSVAGAPATYGDLSPNAAFTVAALCGVAAAAEVKGCQVRTHGGWRKWKKTVICAESSVALRLF